MIWQAFEGPLPPKTLLALALLGVGVRIVCVVALQSWSFERDYDFGYEMGQLGATLVQDGGFLTVETPPRPTAKFPPLYPVVVAAFFKIFGVFSVPAAIGLFVFQIVCAAVSTILLMRIGERVFDRRAGLIAGMIWAFYPTSIFFSSVRIWYSELAVMLLLAVVAITVTGESPLALGRIACLAVLSGLLVLTDSTMILYLPLLALWAAYRGARNPAGLIGRFGAWAVVFLVVCSPWLVRNWSIWGTPLLAKSNLGLELVLGNASELRKTVGQEQMGNEMESQRVLRDLALRWIRQHPERFARLTLRRVVYFWGGNPGFGPEFFLRLMYFVPLLFLAIVGLWRGLREKRVMTPLWLFLLVYPLPYYVTHVGHGRYIYPVEPIVVLLAALPLAVLWGRRATVRRMPLTD
ncbi:MAG: ArnT family glycosyltransferase [Gemmatimonadota bacterium]